MYAATRRPSGFGRKIEPDGRFLREFLTGLAILVIGVLFMALVAPLFVDFNERRAFVEETLSRAAGTRIAVGGAISVRFLPFPVVKLEGVTVGSKATGIEVKADRVALDIGTMPLLKGEIHVMEATVEHPIMSLAILPDGRMPKFPALSADADQSSAWTVRIETLALRNGELSFVPTSDAAPVRLSKLDLDVEAAALSGPWHVEGTGQWHGRPVTVRLSTGALDEAGLLRARAGIERKGGGFRAELDGIISTRGDSGFDGKLRLDGDMAWPEDNDIGVRPVSLTSAIRLAGRGFDISSAEIQAGGDESGFKLTGSGNGKLGRDGGMTLLLDARQIDLDRTLPVEGRNFPPLLDVLSAWRGILLASDQDLTPSLPVDVTLSVESVLAGGDTIKNLRLDTHLDAEGVKLKQGEADLPGGARLVAKGDIGLSEGGAFFGKANFTAKDFPRFGAWVDGETSGRSARFGEARDIAVEGDIALSSSLIGASNLKVRLDKSTLTGLVRYAMAEEGTRARLDAQLASDGFDIDQLPDFPMMAARLGVIDASVLIDARNVRTARVKDAHAGRVQLKARASDEGLVIDTLDIADLGGATVKASGRLTAVGEKVEAMVDAPDMAPLSILFGKLFPGRVTSLITERARSISPVHMTVSAERLNNAAQTIRLSYDGTAATTSINGNGRVGFGDAGLAFDLGAKIVSSDAANLLRQAGATLMPVPLAGGARLDLHAKGDQKAGTTLTVDSSVANVNGSATLVIAADTTNITGPIKVETVDAAPLLTSFGVPLPDATFKMPLAGTASLDISGDLVSLTKLDAVALGQKIKGALTYKPSAAKLEGDIKADALSFPALASLMTGPLYDPVAGSIWPSTRFSEVGPPPIDVAMTMQIDRLDTGLGAKLSNVKTQLLWQPETLEFRSIDGRLFDVPFSGSFTLRRQGSLATYLGKVAVKGVALSDLFPRAGLGGSADIQFDGGGSGESLAAFAASLSGGGQMKISGLMVPAFDIDALATTTRALDGERDPPELKRVTDMVATGLTRGALQLSELSAPLTGSSGIIRFGPLDARQGTHGLQGNLSLDMRTLKLDGRIVIGTKDVPNDWTAPAPQAILTLKGQTTSGIARDVDVTNLTNILTTRAVARELARIEAQESDLRERAFFARRLKVERELVDRARREAEEARLAEEARKVQEDAETKRILEELKAKEEEAQKNAIDPSVQSAPDQTQSSDPSSTTLQISPQP